MFGKPTVRKDRDWDAVFTTRFLGDTARYIIRELDQEEAYQEFKQKKAKRLYIKL